MAISRKHALQIFGIIGAGLVVAGCTEQERQIPTPRADLSLPEITSAITAIVTQELKNEDQIWEALPNLLNLITQAYKQTYPDSLISEPPPMRILNLDEYIAAIREQDPLGMAPTKEVAQTLYSSLLADGTIIINKDAIMARNTINLGLYNNLISQYPSILSEEVAHKDRKPAILEPSITLPSGMGDIEFTICNGFGIESPDSGWKFTLIEEAASVALSAFVQQRLGVNPNYPSGDYMNIVSLLNYQMEQCGIGIYQLQAFHTSSDFDGLLTWLYPDDKYPGLDINERRVKAITDYNTAYNQNTGIPLQELQLTRVV